MFEGLSTRTKKDHTFWNKTMLLAVLAGAVISMALYFFVTFPMTNSNRDVSTQIADLVVSTEDLNGQLSSANTNTPDSVSARANALRSILEKLAPFNTSVTPSSEAILNALVVPGVTFEYALLDQSGQANPSGETSPKDFYNGAGSVSYVRYKVTASAGSLQQLVDFTAAVNNAPTLLTLVNPVVTYTEPSKGATSPSASEPWQLTGEVWVWGSSGSS